MDTEYILTFYQDAIIDKNKYINELIEENRRLKFELEIANRKLADNKICTNEEQELIELGRAFKKITQEIKT